jgi:DNA-binding transcriptional LysR family regulator
LRFGEPPVGSFVARKLIETRVLTVASPCYIKAHGKPRHPKEIEERDCIDFYDAANARPYDWEMRRKKEVLPLRVKARLLVSDSGTLIGACEAGAGIGQVLEIGCAEYLRAGRLVELFPEWSDERFPLYAVYPSRLHRAAKVRAFIEFCLEIMAGEQNAVPRKAR